MFSVGPWQLLILLLVVLLLFGSRLPALARSIGRSVIEFKKGIGEIEDHSADNADQESDVSSRPTSRSTTGPSGH